MGIIIGGIKFWEKSCEVFHRFYILVFNLDHNLSLLAGKKAAFLFARLSGKIRYRYPKRRKGF